LRLTQGKLAEGKALLEQALQHDPDMMRALTILVTYDLSAKQPAKAIARVQQLLEKSPQNPGLYSELALIQLQTKDFAGALANSKKAMDMNPADGQSLMVYTRAEVATGDADGAIATWTKWIGTHPTDAAATSIVGSLEEAKGDQAKAIEYYKKTLQIDPSQAVAANNLAYLMVETGQNVDVALSLAQSARRSLPNSPDTADTLAWVYYYKGTYMSARDLLEDALKNNPDNAAMQYHLGMVYSKLNDKANAQLHLKKATTIAPNSPAAKQASAELTRLG
jgi:tetratricopeptide (TPR) repeat protein